MTSTESLSKSPLFVVHFSYVSGVPYSNFSLLLINDEVIIDEVSSRSEDKLCSDLGPVLYESFEKIGFD